MTSPQPLYLSIPCYRAIVFRQLPTMPDPCWEWLTGIDIDGYARIKMKRTTLRLPRVFYQLFRGDIHSTEVVMHKCDNPPCINPSHLFKGTHADNIADCRKKGRGVYGARTCSAKLTDDKVIELRQRYNNGASSPLLAKEIGLSTSTMQNVLFGRTWVHIPNPCKPRSMGNRSKESL